MTDALRAVRAKIASLPMKMDETPGILVIQRGAVFAIIDDAMREATDENARLRAALVALTTNPHLNLGDLVYTVREREGLGWEGPAVKAWSDAVQATYAAIGRQVEPD